MSNEYSVNAHWIAILAMEVFMKTLRKKAWIKIIENGDMMAVT